MRPRADAPRIAVIEIGTNSTKLVVAQETGGGSFRVLHFSRRTTRIGRGLGRGGKLSARAVEDTARAIGKFQKHVTTCKHRFAFGTYALRKARLTARATRRLRGALGCPLKILTGREEAHLAFRSARHGLRLSKPAAVLVDVGGGSTEVVLAVSGRVVCTRSLPLGALHLTERFLASDPVAPNEFSAMERHIRSRVESAFRSMAVDRCPPGGLEMVASGGAVTTAAGLTGGDPFRAGTTVRVGDVSTLLRRLLAMSVAARRQLPGLEPDRADIIPAGLALIREFLRGTGKRVLRIDPGGVREGAVLHLIENGFRWQA
ncbi:MAG: hypothetical protein ACE5EO_00260 [Candidatus Krumholzibacteriia bacterium]